MNTTIDIPEPLYQKAAERARSLGSTVRDLIVTALSREMKEPDPPSPAPAMPATELYEKNQFGFLVRKRPPGDTTVTTNAFVNQLREELGV
jgi:hypothetical protein